MPETELRRLQTVNRFLQLTISKEKELQQIVELAAKICDSPIAMITFMDKEFQYIQFKTGTDILKLSVDETFCQYTILEKDFFEIEDVLADERGQHKYMVLEAPYVRSYAGVPLNTHDDQTLGTLCVFGVKPASLSVNQKKMLQRLSTQVTRLLEFEASLHLLKEQYESSLAEETKLRSFFESSNSCHLLLDTKTRLLFFNKTTANVLFDSYGIVITEGMLAIEFVQLSFIDQFLANYNAALNGQSVYTETILESPVGEVSWYLTYEPAYDAEHNVIGVSYSATDISQMIRHERIVHAQDESFRQINRILSAELHRPLATATEAMNKIKARGYPTHLTEFELLDISFEELVEKARTVLNINHNGNAVLEDQSTL